MRKGLVVTLGVVALVLLVTPAFSLAPVISCIPDIIISDAEQNQSVDQNFFIFSGALNLDEYVRDDDTSKALIKWCFVETGGPGNVLRINRIAEVPTPDQATLKDPGAYNLRAVSRDASFRNALWSSPSGSPPFSNPGATSMSTTIELYASDGTSYTQQSMIVRTVNVGVTPSTDTVTQRDAKPAKAGKKYYFATQEDWDWFDASPTYAAPAHSVAGGRLVMTQSQTQTAPIVYGSWESTKNAVTGLKARWGCILRARFKMYSSTPDTTRGERATPSFRFRGYWTRVVAVGSVWLPNFLHQDINDLQEVNVSSLDLDVIFVPGRMPGASGQTYTMLYYPQQTDKLMTTDAVVYVTADLNDQDFANDYGTLEIDEVTVDGVDRPELGTGTSIPALTTTSFSSWRRDVQLITSLGTPTTAGLVAQARPTELYVYVPPGNEFFDAAFSCPGSAAMTPGSYYRTLWTVTTSQTPGGDIAPTVRVGVISSRLAFWVVKGLDGGGLYSSITSTPTPFEMWMCAPSPMPPSTTQTEPMTVRFEVYSLGKRNYLFNKNVSGTVRCLGVQTESFPAAQ